MNPSPTSLPITSLGHPHAPAPSMLYPALDIDWWFNSYMIVYMLEKDYYQSCNPLGSQSTVLSGKSLLSQNPLGCFSLLETWASGRRAPPTLRLWDERLAVVLVNGGPIPTDTLESFYLKSLKDRNQECLKCRFLGSTSKFLAQDGWLGPKETVFYLFINTNLFILMGG